MQQRLVPTMDTIEDTHGDDAALVSGHVVSLRKHAVVAGGTVVLVTHGEK